MAEKVNYNAMDVAKFLSAVLLVCAHTASERVSLLEYWICVAHCILLLFHSSSLLVHFFFLRSWILKQMKKGLHHTKSTQLEYGKCILLGH